MAGDPRIVYLDQNKWVELLRAEKSGDSNSTALEVLTRLETSVRSGEVIVVLSAANYLETWHRGNWRSRHELAAMMRRVTDFRTLLPIHHTLCLEVEAFLLRNYRWPGCRCAAPEVGSHVLGRGVNHAFNSVTGRLRLVDSVAEDGRLEGVRLAPSRQFLETWEVVQQAPNDAYEWWSLAGDQGSLPQPGLEVTGEHRHGMERMRRENALAQRIAGDGYLKSRLDDYLIAEELTSILEVFNRIGHWHGSNTDRLAAEHLEGGPEFGRKMVAALPTSECNYQLRRAKHRNPQWPWQQHDATDIGALAVAVPYADVVVTERQWSHVFRSTGLDRRYSTVVLGKLAELLPHL